MSNPGVRETFLALTKREQIERVSTLYFEHQSLVKVCQVLGWGSVSKFKAHARALGIKFRDLHRQVVPPRWGAVLELGPKGRVEAIKAAIAQHGNEAAAAKHFGASTASVQSAYANAARKLGLPSLVASGKRRVNTPEWRALVSMKPSEQLATLREAVRTQGDQAGAAKLYGCSSSAICRRTRWLERKLKLTARGRLAAETRARTRANAQPPQAQATSASVAASRGENGSAERASMRDLHRSIDAEMALNDVIARLEGFESYSAWAQSVMDRIIADALAKRGLARVKGA